MDELVYRNIILQQLIFLRGNQMPIHNDPDASKFKIPVRRLIFFSNIEEIVSIHL